MGRGELGVDGTPRRRPGDIKTSERYVLKREKLEEIMRKRKKNKRKESGKGKGQDKRARSGCKHAKEEKEASMWWACGCEQRRQQVRHGSITNNTRV